MENIVAFVKDNPDAVRKGVAEKAQVLKTGFRRQWARKLRQLQVPAFTPNTMGSWVLRFDDILADALELGPQQNFNAYFGNTNFSQKWIGVLNGKLIEKKVLDGVCKYRILLSIQE